MSFLCQNEPVNEALITAARCFPHQVARVKPSKTQLKVLDAIKKGESVTAQQMAERCELSQSFTSTLLKGLVERGYLVRNLESRMYGGVEYNYSIIVN